MAIEVSIDESQPKKQRTLVNVENITDPKLGVNVVLNGISSDPTKGIEVLGNTSVIPKKNNIIPIENPNNPKVNIDLNNNQIQNIKNDTVLTFSQVVQPKDA